MLELHRSCERVRHAISLPNILFGVEEEEIEKLVEEEPVLHHSYHSEGKKTEPKKWYKKFQGAGRLFTPIRNSIIKIKRKHDNYSLQGDNTDANKLPEVRVETPEALPDEVIEQVASDELEQSNTELTFKDIVYSSQGENLENIGIDKRSKSLGEHYEEARAYTHKHLTISDMLYGRYRKF